jgi:hypothetical protein
MKRAASSSLVALAVAIGLSASCGGNVIVQASNDGGSQDGTTICGAARQACCNGAACDNGLTCAGGTCTAVSCGGLGEPCCDGTACNAGLTCGGGTCEAVGDGDASDVSDAADSGGAYEQSVVLAVAWGVTPASYQVRLALSAATVGAHFQWANQCTDLRFVDPVTSASLPYWTESCSAASRNAVVWVKYDGAISTTGSVVEMHYGGPATTSQSSGPDTFIFFDDFSGSTLGQWWSTYLGLGSLSVANSLSLSCASTCDWWQPAPFVNDAPRIYQSIAADATFETYVQNNHVATNHWTGIFISDNATGNDSSNTYMAAGAGDNLCYESIGVGCGGAQEPTDGASDYYLEFSKSGTTYSFSYSDDEVNWMNLGAVQEASAAQWGLMMKDWGGGVSDGYFYFVFVRQYNAVEPTAVWGAETSG